MLLLCSALIGELHPLPHVSLRAAGAIAYLIVAGSLIAFTSYEWLLSRMPATKISSFAYVNPVVALAIGHWVAGEHIGLRTFLGAVLILASVVAILRNKTAEYPNSGRRGKVSCHGSARQGDDERSTNLDTESGKSAGGTGDRLPSLRQ